MERELSPKGRRAFGLLLTLLAAISLAALAVGVRPSEAASAGPQNNALAPAEPPDLANFRQSVGGDVRPVLVELRQTPGVLRRLSLENLGRAPTFDDLVGYARNLVQSQDQFLASLAGRGVRALLRRADVPQPDGSTRRVEWRFTYLFNGMVLYIAADDLARLRSLPEVKSVRELQPTRFLLDRAIDYILGTQFDPAARRLAVYGNEQQLQPRGAPGHPEAPSTNRNGDGFEGQNINIAIIDSGVDWRHPMFGGIGQTTPLPRISGMAESPNDNRKVIYYYALSSPGDPTDDFGHGTLVAACAAGYAVDGNTPPRTGYGTGRDGTGIGPTPSGTQLHGTAPQARIMAYKVCGPAPQCLGDIELAMEDAASPYTLLGASGGPLTTTAVRKPVADVINLSLGDTAGDTQGSTAIFANNAALAGTIVVASAGNSGPGSGTVGSPAAATLAIAVGANLDPGSTSGADVLAPNQIPGETRAPAAGPPPETGAASEQNVPQPNERQGMKLFPVAGGGPLPNGSLSAHYVFVDRRNPANPIPPSVTNRIAVVKGTGAFAAIANAVAPFRPAAILIVTTVESATAVAVAGGIPTYTINPNDGDYLLDLLSSTDNDAGDPTPGLVSELPLRLSDSITLDAFEPNMAGFSSRGPNDHPNARFRTIKPDVTAPGVGIVGAATPDGLPDEALGLASPTGYTQANGTSFSGPIAAGAVALIRQRVREELGLDATNISDPKYRSKRFDAVTISRALLMNTATNLRNGRGVPQGDGAASVASINDMGAGLINVAGALDARAIMVAPTLLLREEYSPPANDPPQYEANGALKVLLPSASFGAVPVVGLNGTLVRTQEVIIRDITRGGGSGAYTLTFQNNRNADNPGFQISFTDANGNPINSVNVPAGGQASFFVRVVADGQRITVDPTEFQWYVTATHSSSGRTLRMPFYYRAVRAQVANLAAPDQAPIEGTEQPATTGCATDSNGNYRLRWSYTPPNGGPLPIGFRIQEATRSQTLFFDNADEPLVAGSNSKWSGSAQWTTQSNPNTGSFAYYIADLANQNESLTLRNPIVLPAGGATLTFTTTQDFEDGFDNGFVEVSTDGGANWTTVAIYADNFVGTRTVDLSAFAGRTILLRFRMVSDLLNGPPDAAPLGWYIEDIRVSADDFRTLAEVGASVNAFDITGRSNGTYFYRIAGLFDTPEGAVIGPYSNTRCATVNRIGLP